MRFSPLEARLISAALPEKWVEQLLSSSSIPQAAVAETEPDDALAHLEFDLDEPSDNGDVAISITMAACLSIADAARSERTLEQVFKPGRLTVITVPDRSWVSPIADAVAAISSSPTRPTGEHVHLRRLGKRNDLVLIEETDNESSNPAKAEARKASLTAQAVASGLPVIAVATTAEAVLPKDALAGIDSTIEVTALTPARIRRVIRAVCGSSPRGSLSTRAAAAVTPLHLTLAVRSRSAPGRCLDRLAAMVDAPAVTAEDKRTLADLHGMSEFVRYIREVEADLPDYLAGRLPWSAMSRGVIFEGPPGTGKTTGAAIAARHLGVRLVATSVADWLAYREGHLGEFCRAVRETFEKARAEEGVVLLAIDEIDSIPPSASSDAHGERWWRPARAALLTALDGLVDRQGIIVLGLCNDASRLDPTLVRAGRFDRTISIGLPAVPELEGVLKTCLRPALQTENLTHIAARMAGAAAADVAQLVRDASRRARMAGREIGVGDLEAVLAERRPPLEGSLLRRVSLHEAGHAIAALRLGLDVGQVHVGERGEVAGSAGIALPRSFAGTWPELDVALTVLLSGRAAEQHFLGSPSAGARQDLQQATQLLEEAVLAGGMGTNLRWRNPRAGGSASSIPVDAAEEIEDRLRKALAAASNLVVREASAVERVASELAIRNFLDGDALRELVSRLDHGSGKAVAPGCSSSISSRGPASVPGGGSL